VATGLGLGSGLQRLAAHTRHFEQLAGVVMILAGLGQLYLAIVVLNVL
jgi:cytochrome c-type biogenesis protein